jgi:deoxyribose-phosphate aldolase
MSHPFDYPSIAKMIDHSLLNPTLTTPELEEGCALAIRYNVASVCILPYALARCAELLADTGPSTPAPPSAFPTAATPPQSSWPKSARP